MRHITQEEQIQEMVKQGYIFYINHSAGKDSQAMTIYLRSLVPLNQLVIIYSHLPEVVWDGTKDHIYKYSNGIPVRITQAKKTFWQMVEWRKMFPSPSNRQCTSDLKRGPLEKLIRQLCKEYDNNKVVSCEGKRAQESPSRAKQPIWKYNERNSKAGREWWDFLPIHSWIESEVFDYIKSANEKPFWVYSAGMKRNSCCFCIMACNSDIKTAAKLRPELAKKYMEFEEKTGFTMRMPSKKHGKQYIRDIINN